MLKQAREKEEITAVADKFSTPTYTRDIAEMLPPLFADPTASGILHYANVAACSWRDYAQWALDCCHSLGVPMRARTVGALRLADMKNFIAKRPVHSVLGTQKYERLTGRKPRTWRD